MPAATVACMEPKDRTIEVLKQVRDETKRNGERIEETNVRLNETNARIDQTRDELSRRIVESEMRTATAITDLSGTIRDLVTNIKEDRDLRSRVDRCEREIASLKARLPDA